MKTSLVAFVLALSAIAVGQTTAPQSQAQPAGSQPAATQQPGTAPAAGQPGAPPQKKEIKDPAEYNAYVSAVQQKDPAAQICVRKASKPLIWAAGSFCCTALT